MVERFTKCVVLVSAIAAVLFELRYAGQGWPRIVQAAPVVAVLAFALGRRFPEPTAGIVLALGYLTPALYLLGGAGFRYWYLSLWTLAFLAVLVSTTTLTWKSPSPFRFPLVAWALVVAITWPLVALRELDWMPSLLWTRPPLRNDAIYAIPTTVWFSNVAQVHLVGLLWIDWLFGRFASDKSNKFERFEQIIVQPLLIAATLAAALAVYQGFVNLNFLSLSVWAGLGRASGALADGNASGSLSALWVAIPIALIARSRSQSATLILLTSTVVLFLGVWMTGSRTSLLAAIVSLAVVVHLVASDRRNRSRLLIGLGLATTALLIAFLILPSAAQGPLRRVRELVPTWSVANLQSAATMLWERNGYGRAAVAMLKDQPIQGVGVGAFHSLSIDYVRELSMSIVPADNAQNWFRHQLAELGFVGSVGWIWWTVLLLIVIVRGRGRPDDRSAGLVLKYTLAGFGLASMLGVPAQDLFVSLTVWTLIGWLLLLTIDPDVKKKAALSGRGFSLAIVLSLVCATMTVYAGRHTFRPVFRAARFGYLYQYGFDGLFDGTSGQVHANAHAAASVHSLTSIIKLTVSVDHPDADAKPVAVDVWVDDERVMRGHFPRNVPMTAIVPVVGGGERFVIETKADRTYASGDPKNPDVGLTVAWEFIGR